MLNTRHCIIGLILALSSLFCSCSGGGKNGGSGDSSTSASPNNVSVSDTISGLLPPDINYGTATIISEHFEAELQITVKNVGSGGAWEAFVTGSASLKHPDLDPANATIAVDSIMEKMAAVDERSLRISLQKQGASDQPGLEIHEMQIIFDTIDDNAGQRVGRLASVNLSQFYYYPMGENGLAPLQKQNCDQLLSNATIIIKFNN